MKKKIFSLLLLLTLLFVVGCNKEEGNSDPTPTTALTEDATSTPAPTATSTPTPTPTPIPENLAMTSLKKLPAGFESLMASRPETTVDYANGVGYDLSMDLTLNKELLALLEIEGLDNISLDGSFDIKDVFAANCALSLNETEVLTAALYTDAETLMFNLPKYSTAYAAVALEELFGTSLTDLQVEMESLPSDEVMLDFIQLALDGLVDCFKPQDGVVANATIGTGDYVMTGDKHTVIASAADLQAYVTMLEAAAAKIPGMTLDTEDFAAEDVSVNFVLNYYTNADGSYAWECYSDNVPDEPAVFVSTPKGFCFYGISDGVTEVLLYSVATSENAGVITIPSNDATTADFNIDYETGENSFAFHLVEDTVEMSLAFSNVNGTVTYKLEMVVDGISIVMEETATSEKADITMSIGSYGMNLATLDMLLTVRDYVEVPAPQNTTDIVTWTAGLDQDALTADLLQLMSEFPFLMDLILGSETDDPTGGDVEIDVPGGNTGSYTLPEGYTDDFMNMTGYAVDETGYVDFDPLEEEVLAAGKPSTGYDSLKITDDQKQALMDYAEKYFAKCDKDIDTFYWVWGSTKYDDVESFYLIEYDFEDSDSWDNSITLGFDAVSGEFISVEIYNESKDEALRIANDLLKLLNVDITVTAELVESYSFKDNFSFSGYDGAEYGSNYYNVGFKVYYPEW